jgi:flavin-binding protein dodecin
MTDSVYKFITLVGSSPDSWDKAAMEAIQQASQTLRDLRVARVIDQDIHIEGDQLTYRVKLELSYRYEGS